VVGRVAVSRPTLVALFSVTGIVVLSIAQAGADSFSNAMAAAATILTIAILSEAVAAAVTTVALSEVATITAVAGGYFAAGGALNVGIGLTLMALPVVGLIAAVIAVGAAAVIISNIPAPVTAANIQANAITPPDGTPPAVTALGFMGANGTLLNLQVVGGRGSDPGDDLDEMIQAAINASLDAGSGLAPGDVPGPPGPCCPGTGLSLDVSPADPAPDTSSDVSGDVGLFMVANPPGGVAVAWPPVWLFLTAGLAWLVRKAAP
jgi:hypothetical protein